MYQLLAIDSCPWMEINVVCKLSFSRCLQNLNPIHSYEIKVLYRIAVGKFATRSIEGSGLIPTPNVVGRSGNASFFLAIPGRELVQQASWHIVLVYRPTPADELFAAAWSDPLFIPCALDKRSIVSSSIRLLF